MWETRITEVENRAAQLRIICRFASVGILCAGHALIQLGISLQQESEVQKESLEQYEIIKRHHQAEVKDLLVCSYKTFCLIGEAVQDALLDGIAEALHRLAFTKDTRDIEKGLPVYNRSPLQSTQGFEVSPARSPGALPASTSQSPGVSGPPPSAGVSSSSSLRSASNPRPRPPPHASSRTLDRSTSVPRPSRPNPQPNHTAHADASATAATAIKTKLTTNLKDHRTPGPTKVKEMSASRAEGQENTPPDVDDKLQSSPVFNISKRVEMDDEWLAQAAELRLSVTSFPRFTTAQTT